MKSACLTLFVFLFSFNLSTLYAQDFDWAIAAGSPGFEEVLALEITPTSEIVVAGAFNLSVDFSPGPNTTFLHSNGINDLFVAKYDTSGNLIWAVSMGGTSYDIVNDLAIDAQGNIYITGYFSGSVDFDPGPGTFSVQAQGGTDGFVAKLNASGDFQWVAPFQSNNNANGAGIAIDPTGNAIVTGSFEGTTDFSPGNGNHIFSAAGSYDFFVLQVDSTGNVNWVSVMTGPYAGFGSAVVANAAGDCFISGRFVQTVDFDPGPGVQQLTSAGSYDAFVMSLNTSGELKWVKSFSGEEQILGSALALDAQSNLYITGKFEDSVDFDPGAGVAMMHAPSGGNAYIVKLSESGQYHWSAQLATPYESNGNSIDISAAGEVYTVGHFSGALDFDPGPGQWTLQASSFLGNSFVSKLDTAGNFIWGKSLGSPDGDESNAVKTDPFGNVFTGGAFKGIMDFDPGSGTAYSTAEGDWDLYVHRMSSVTPLGLEDEIAESQFQLFPNPTSGEVVLQAEKSLKDAHITVMNSLGQIVQSQSFNGFSERVTLPPSPGIYFLHVDTQLGAQVTKRIIKN